MVSQRAQLDVYLIHYHAPEWLLSALDSLARSEGVNVSLAVVDNGGLDRPLPEGVRLIRAEQNRGFTGGANDAIADWWDRNPASDRMMLGTHDLHVERDTLESLVVAAMKHPDFGVIAPELRLGAIGPVVLEGSQIDERAWVTGTCMLLHRECLAAIGGFDEDFGSYVEDVEFCSRVRDAGWKVGSVRGVEAWGLGTASDRALEMQFVNDIVLRRKRRGRWAVAKGIVWQLLMGVVELFRSLLTLRSAPESARLRHRAASRLRAILGAPSRLSSLRKDGGNSVPRFGNSRD